jgi:photosystem II stability/assembly factor-like uncharacterized protein
MSTNLVFVFLFILFYAHRIKFQYNCGFNMKKLIFAIIAFVSLPNSYSQWMQMPSMPTGFFQNLISINDTLYASNLSSGVYRSVDGTATWHQINNGLSNSQSKQVYEVLSYNGSLYAATVDGIYKSTNGGSEWIKKSSGITIGPGALNEFCESIYEYNGTLFTGAHNGIYRSTDNAENWIITNISGSHIKAKNFTNHNGILFAARESINTPNGYESTDNGVNWSSLTGMNFPTISFLSEFPKLWAGTIHGVWLSTDNGNSWQQRSNGLAPDPYNTTILRVNGVLVTSLHFGGSGVYISANEGILWENFGQGLPFLNNIEKLIVYNDKLIAATSSGLWQRNISEIIPVELISFNASVNGNDVILDWVTVSEVNNLRFEILRLAQNDIWEMVGFVDGSGTTSESKYYSFIDRDLISGKYSYRLKQIDFDGSFEYSDIVEAEVASPNEFFISQNYPNPFNPSTTIRYKIPFAGFVSLKIYDVLGNEILILVNEEKPAGSYEVKFNASDLPSGIYLYKLQAGSFFEMKKMTLLK